jgi:DNA-binding response OmpR family regulator
MAVELEQEVLPFQNLRLYELSSKVREAERRMRILLVEDNDELSGLVVKSLEAAGFGVDHVAGAKDALNVLGSTHYAAVMLDLGLPDEDGLSVLRTLRARHHTVPVLILTARDGVNDRVAGLRAGADDYLVKPFAFEELVARLEALLRRPGQLIGRSLELGNLVLDTAGRQLYINGEPQMLSARELALLEILMRRSGRVVAKRAVEDQIYGLSAGIGSNAIEVYVHRLRKSLQDLGATAAIHTIRGVGYLITAA